MKNLVDSISITKLWRLKTRKSILLLLISFLTIYFSFVSSLTYGSSSTKWSLDNQIIKKKIIKPKPIKKFYPVSISGHVLVPDGRGLGGIIIKLYEFRNGGYSYISSTTTTRKGFYLIRLGAQWLNKTVKLVPKHPAFSEGEHFSRTEDRFQIVSDKMVNRNFRYTGPLPDLEVKSYELRKSDELPTVKLFYIVKNRGLVESGKFKIKIVYKKAVIKVGLGRRTYPEWERKETIIYASSIPPNSSEENETTLGEGDKGNFDILFIQIDIDDSVIESNEANNIYH